MRSIAAWMAALIMLREAFQGAGYASCWEPMFHAFWFEEDRETTCSSKQSSSGNHSATEMVPQAASESNFPGWLHGKTNHLCLAALSAVTHTPP